jgi:hypothetical protein
MSRNLRQDPRSRSAPVRDDEHRAVGETKLTQLTGGLGMWWRAAAPVAPVNQYNCDSVVGLAAAPPPSLQQMTQRGVRT